MSLSVRICSILRVGGLKNQAERYPHCATHGGDDGCGGHGDALCAPGCPAHIHGDRLPGLSAAAPDIDLGRQDGEERAGAGGGSRLDFSYRTAHGACPFNAQKNNNKK